MHKKLIFGVVFCIFFTVVKGQNKEEKKIIIQEIETKGQLLSGFYKASLADSIASMFTPNTYFVPNKSEILDSREAVSNFYLKEFAAGKIYQSFEFKPEDYKVYDDIVLEIGVNTRSYTKPGSSSVIKEEYNYLFIWKASKKGNYRIRTAMWNMPR